MLWNFFKHPIKSVNPNLGNATRGRYLTFEETTTPNSEIWKSSNVDVWGATLLYAADRIYLNKSSGPKMRSVTWNIDPIKRNVLIDLTAPSLRLIKLQSWLAVSRFWKGPCFPVIFGKYKRHTSRLWSKIMSSIASRTKRFLNILNFIKCQAIRNDNCLFVQAIFLQSLAFL